MKNSIAEKAKRAEELLETSEICKEEAERVKSLRSKLENQAITVSVIGQFKRGKSTLVNAILGEKLLPVGIVPVTSVVTIIEYGERDAAVHFDNGMIKSIAIEELSEYINEQENPNNALCVSSVKLRTPAPFLEEGISFVDTPGVGSIHKHNSDTAYAFVKESDAVIFMLSVDSPINEIEIDFLSNAKEHAAKFYFAVNKIDNVEEEELASYVKYCRKLLCGLMGVEEVMMFPVSARYGTGIEELKDKIQRDCKLSVKEILEDSAAMRLKDIIKSAKQKLDLYWNALKLPTGKLEVRFEQMKQTLADIEAESLHIVTELEKETDESKYLEISERLELRLNEMKQQLSRAVTELFGMEYHYAITELKVGDAYRFDTEATTVKALREKFMNQTRRLIEELSDTLNLILLYKEKNTITVLRRIEDLNKLTRNLRGLLATL